MSVDEMIRHMIGKDMEQIHVKRRPDTAGRKELLRVERLSRKKEFRDVSFHIDEGEILGIAGLVGAGRTELANAIFGVSKPDEGEMYWEGRKIHIGSQRDAIGIGIGYVPEERRRLGIFPVLSVTENLTMPLLSAVLKWSGIDSSRERKLIHRYIGELKIKTSSPDKQIRLLSGGNQQKVILARWLAKKVKLLILDEPTRGIDVGAKREIHELIRKLAAEGMSVLLISSELEEVIQLSDRIMVLHEGRVKGFFDAAEVTKEQLLSTALA
jgi:ABC-type sugar transport system ATPase subunit